MAPAARIVNDEDMEKALDFLRDSAREIGDAKGETIRCGHMMKVTKALIMKQHNELSAAKAEVEAYCSQRYMDALTEDAMAAAKYETMRAIRDAAAMKIEAWRSEQASLRAMKI